MDRESMASLRLDKRLAGRRGWIAPEELVAELENLADATDKILGDDDGDEAVEEAAASGLPD